MTLKINLTATATGAGVDFNTSLTAQFADFTPYQMPVFLNRTGSSETTQILHLDTPSAGEESNTRFVLLEGDDFDYTFSNHSVSGTISTIRLGTLGAGWDADASDLALTNGLLMTAATSIAISGLTITNPAGVKGDVHEVVAGMMGGGLNGTNADGTPITDAIWAQAHDVTGSTGADRYSGTGWADTIRGAGGNDTLGGAGGADRIVGGNGADRLSGGAGRDRLQGGNGPDVLTGGSGPDVFQFATVDEANGDRITDFSVVGGDMIHLAAIDANEGASGDQGFKWLGTRAFSGAAGELRMQTVGTTTVLTAHTDADGIVDLRLVLSGHLSLTAADFLL